MEDKNQTNDSDVDGAEVQVTNTDSFVINDKDGNAVITINRADLPLKTLYALEHRALSHIFRNELSSAVGNQEEKNAKPDATELVDLDAYRAAWVAKKAASLRDGSLGVREGVSRISPLERHIRDIVEAGVKRIAASRNVKLPKAAADLKAMHDKFRETNLVRITEEAQRRVDTDNAMSVD